MNVKKEYIITLFFLIIFVISSYFFEGIWGRVILLDHLKSIAYFFICIVFISLAALNFDHDETQT